MPRVEFEAGTLDELVEMARRWVAAYPELGFGLPDVESAGVEQLEDVLRRITSPTTRQFLREAAESSRRGDALVIDDGLRARLGRSPGDSLVGILGVANRTMRRRARRELLTWDPDVPGYRMDREDAAIVLEVLGRPTDTEPTATSSR